MELGQIAANIILPILTILSASWWFGRKASDTVTRADLDRLETNLKADMAQQKDELRADNIRLEESLKAEIVRVEEKADKRFEQVDSRFDQVDSQFERVGNKFEHLREQNSGNEGKLYSLGEKSDYIIRQVERIEARQYQQVTGLASTLPAEEEN